MDFLSTAKPTFFGKQRRMAKPKRLAGLRCADKRQIMFTKISHSGQCQLIHWPPEKMRQKIRSDKLKNHPQMAEILTNGFINE